MSLLYDVVSDSLNKDQLLVQIEAYNTSVFKKDNIIEDILKRYYEPHHAEFDDRLRSNLKILQDYPYVYAPSELPKIYPVWFDDQEAIYYDDGEKNFVRLRRLNPAMLQIQRNTVIAIIAQFWTDDMLDYESRTSLEPNKRIYDMEIPLYLIYTPEEWAAFLQLADIEPLLKFKRIVFLAGDENFKEYFSDDGVIHPLNGYSTKPITEINKIFKELYQSQHERLNSYINEIQNYYSDKGAEIDKHFIDGKPKILSITTLFGLSLMYYTRDTMAAFSRMGCDTATLIEKDPLHRVNSLVEAKAVAEIKPDAVFCISHIRYEHDVKIYPQEIIFIVWIQDPLPVIMDPLTPLKLTKRDFFMNHFTTWRQLLRINYDRGQMIDAPIPANNYIYKPYDLTEDEMRYYGADICFVAHSSDIAGRMQQIIDMFEDETGQRIIKELYKEYFKHADKGIIYYSHAQFRDYITDFLKKRYNIGMDNSLLNYIADHMAKWYNQAVFRQVLADWLITAGFKNIKLWGNGWMKYDKYKPYAMGPAQNGEVLSKIYQASKIVMGNNINATSCARVFESTLSGAFYMANYIPPENDWTDIRKIVNIDTDIVMFYNKKDLLKKVRYYLKHDDERREMARRGREVALSKMTYDALMKRVIDFIGNKLAERSS
ncbi:MAG: glycosyltransferase family 1 protein [Synergistaceae bacterium]|nr:glycosyltransferase family 1 protein [Synergistaceae bacterium]